VSARCRGSSAGSPREWSQSFPFCSLQTCPTPGYPRYAGTHVADGTACPRRGRGVSRLAPSAG
jgi:hypothetical protein